MTNPKIGLVRLAVLAAVALVSCDLFPALNEIGRNNDLSTLEKDSFYALDMETGKYYKVKAEILYEGVKCVIWAEKGSGIPKRQAEEIANVYDTVIRPEIVGRFSKKDFYVNGGADHFDDMLDYANWLAGGDNGKLTVLLLDIKDGFKNAETDSYVAGYFFGGDLEHKGKIDRINYSNGRDMIYVDTYPGLRMKPDQTYITFAHELQHLINYVTGKQMERRYQMDTWVDEGLSSQAEYFFKGENPRDKCEWFSEDREGTIERGNNFFAWDNHPENPLSILDDYATVYLFFRWLYLQADTELQSHIFLDIETSDAYDYRAITNVAKQINPEWNIWENLLRTWLAANYYPGNTYGYTGDPELQKKIKVKPVAESRISLYPGEGVYSKINDPFSPEETSVNIRYAGLVEAEAGIGLSAPYTGDVLLSFNANTRNTGASEIGYLTGVFPAVSRKAAENTQTGKLGGPYVLDARDMLGRYKR